MELKLNENEKEIRKSKKWQPPESTPRYVINPVIQQINKAKEEQYLYFTLTTKNTYLVLKSVNTVVQLEYSGRSALLLNIQITWTNISFF